MLTILRPYQEVLFILAHSASPIDTKPDRVVTYDMGPPLKNHIRLSKKFFPLTYFFLPQKCTFNLTLGPLYDYSC